MLRQQALQDHASHYQAPCHQALYMAHHPIDAARGQGRVSSRSALLLITQPGIKQLLKKPRLHVNVKPIETRLLWGESGVLHVFRSDQCELVQMDPLPACLSSPTLPTSSPAWPAPP